MGWNKWMELGIAAESANGKSSVDASEQTTVTIRLAIAASYSGCVGQGRPGADNTEASRLLQFFRSLVKVLVNRTPDEFRDRSACLVGQLLQLFDLLLFEKEGRPFHDRMIT
jgi:hypothetical protein